MWQARVSLVTWFKLEDERMDAARPLCLYQSGFYRASGTVKPSRTAFRFPFVAFAAHGRVSLWGRTPTGTAATVVIDRKTASGWRRVATVEANRVGIFTKTLRRSWTSGLLRSRAEGESSRPFSLRRPRDRWVAPFGSSC